MNQLNEEDTEIFEILKARYSQDRQVRERLVRIVSGDDTISKEGSIESDQYQSSTESRSSGSESGNGSDFEYDDEYRRSAYVGSDDNDNDDDSALGSLMDP